MCHQMLLWHSDFTKFNFDRGSAPDLLEELLLSRLGRGTPSPLSLPRRLRRLIHRAPPLFKTFRHPRMASWLQNVSAQAHTHTQEEQPENI